MESEEVDAIEAAGAAFLAECARVGFGVRELGAVMISESAGHPRLADAMIVLRALPSGAGFQAFCDRVPDGGALWAAHQARQARETRRPTRCSFCRRAATAERRLVRGAGWVAICRECAESVVDLLE